MSENTLPPAPNTPPNFQPPQRSAGNGFGIASLVLGIVTMAGFAIPILNFATIGTGVVGLALGIIGLIVKFKPRKAAIAGVILTGLGLILSIILVIVYAAALTGATKAIGDAATSQAGSNSSAAPKSTPSKSDAAKPASTHSVTYDVTGDGTKATSVTYLTFNDGSSGTSQANDTAVPFHKVVPIKGDTLFSTSLFSLVAQSADGNTITCKITVDGKVISTNTSTGPYAVATCSGNS